MSSSLGLFHHVYVDNGKDKTLCLLHGTGGDEYDLLGIGGLLSEKYNLLSLRGNIDENGMNRFFRRVGMGVFDQESIRNESKKLSEFANDWNASHPPIDTWLGYSNGANMILAVWFLYPTMVRRAVLLHSMLPFDPDEGLSLIDESVAFVSYGREDFMITMEESVRVADALDVLGVRVTRKEYPGGHGVSKEEIDDVVEWCMS